MTTLLRRRLLLSAWTVLVAAGLAAFVRIGQSTGTPALRTLITSAPPPAPLDPIDAVASIGWVSCIAILGYLMLVIIVQLLASGRGSTRLAGVARRVTPRFLVVMTAGVLVSSGSAFASAGPGPDVGAATAAGGASGPGAAVPTMEVIEPGDTAAQDVPPTDDATPVGASLAPSPVATPRAGPLTSLPWALDPADGSAGVPTAGSAGQVTPTAGVDVEQLPGSLVIHIVQPGDHLWSIAEREVSLRIGSDATDAEVARYWFRLIEANRDRLVDPDDTDLILPGQELILPF